SINYFELASWLFIIGMFIKIGLNITQIIRIFRLKRNCKTILFNNIKCYIVPDKIGSFSFFGMIFITDTSYINGEINYIFTHENVHLNEGHSIDLLIFELVRIIQWFNPFIYLFEKDLKEIHEFIADSTTISIKKNPDNYINVLLNQTIGAQFADLVNSFNSRTILRRLQMLKKPKSKLFRLWKYVLILVPLTLSIFLFACKNSEDIKTAGSKYQIDSLDSRDTIIYDSRAEPEMGWKSFYELVQSIQKMPLEAKANNIAAQIIIAYSVNPDGTMSDFKYHNGKITGGLWTQKSPGFGLDEEAFRVINLISKKIKWKTAMSNNKPVKEKLLLTLDFGDENLWKMYSASYSMGHFNTKKKELFTIDNPCVRKDETKPSFFTDDHYEQITKNIHYPDKAKKANIKGKVIVSFGINNNGCAENAKVEEGNGHGFNEEALRVVGNLNNLIVKGFDHKNKRYFITIEFSTKFEDVSILNKTNSK
ncbi:MAG: TonB family protein, partial [Bacteroidota bacterium]